MTPDLYESVMETLVLASDPEAMAVLRESIKDLAHGRTLSHDEVVKRLGL